jgi:hypothetical protein
MLRRFKNLGYALAVIAFGAIGLQAANLTLFSGPQDPSQLLATINQLIQAINNGVGGQINAQTGAVATGTGTSEQVLQTYTMPANQLSVAGQAIRVSCWGVTGATANVKTRKLYFGASVITTAAEAANAQNWFLELTCMRTGAATQSCWGQGLAGTGGVTPLSYTNQGTDALTAGVVIKCTATDGTSAAADVTANGMLVEQIK